MSVFLMIHGINDSRAGTTQIMGDKLAERGHVVYHVDQTIIKWWQAHDRKKQMKVVLECLEVAREIYEIHGKFSIISHSNGGLVTQYLVHNLEDRRIKNLYMFSPALNKDWTWSQRVHSFDKAKVVYNPNDTAILLAKMLPFKHPWGDMGRYGPVTNDIRVEGKRDDLSGTVWGHNAPFVPPATEHWCDIIEHWEKDSEPHAVN